MRQSKGDGNCAKVSCGERWTCWLDLNETRSSPSFVEVFSVVDKVLAAVRTGPSKTEIREFPMPDVPQDAALMKMEVAGICGTDVKLYKTPPTKSPVIMGHENIGTIAKA